MIKQDSQTPGASPNILRQKLDQVRISVFEETIDREQANLIRLKTPPDHNGVSPEAIQKHYALIDAAYHKLISDIEIPEAKQQYQLQRIDTFVDQCQWRLTYLRTIEQDFSLAIQQYQLLRADIDKMVKHHRELLTPETGELSLNGQAKRRLTRRDLLFRIKKETVDSQAYIRIKQAIDQQSYGEALNQLYASFFAKQNYEYRDVSQLFGQLLGLKETSRQVDVTQAQTVQENKLGLTILIILTSIIIGVLLDNVISLWAFSPIPPYAPLAFVAVLWVSTLLLVVIKRRQK